MQNYKTIREICENTSHISASVIDDFILYYAAARYNLERSMNKEFSSFKHITKEFQTEWVNRFKAQYIAHKIFKKGGLINKMLNHVELQRLSSDEMAFLNQQAQQAWRFSYSVIISKPDKDFFIMEDVFSGEQYTLFSPGISDLEKSQSTILWFNLISYNGSCWQTFGPIIPFKGFEADDIFFFASELNHSIANDDDVLADVERNPLPYMMLLVGANFPLVFHKNDQTIQAYSEYDLSTIDTKKLKTAFKIEYNGHVYRLTLKDWGEHPHFATAYFDEKKEIILLTAMTDRGFRALANSLNKYGSDYSPEPFMRVNITMLNTTNKILKKKLNLNEYDHLFIKEIPKESQEGIDKLNRFMALILPDINAGRKPDLEMLAAAADIDIETAHDIVDNIINKFGKK